MSREFIFDLPACLAGPRNPLAEYCEGDPKADVPAKEKILLREDGTIIHPEDDPSIEDVLVIEGDALICWVDGKEALAREGAYIELDSNGNVTAVSFEFLGGEIDDSQMVDRPYREQKYVAYRDRFSPDPWWVLEEIEDDRLRSEDIKAGTKPTVTRKPRRSRLLRPGKRYYIKTS